MVKRSFRGMLAALFFGCGSGPGPDAPPTDGLVEPEVFSVVTPSVPIDPGQEITYCYFIRSPNERAVAIRKWSTSLTNGGTSLSLLSTRRDVMPPGTFVPNCDFAELLVPGRENPVWLHSARRGLSSLSLPEDDRGQQLVQILLSETPLILRISFSNVTDQAITANAKEFTVQIICRGK